MCRRQLGFSLVEMVIVVIIVGLVGAIALPRMSRGAMLANDAAVAADLQVLRHAIDLYAIEHNGFFPGQRPSAPPMGGDGTPQDMYNHMLQNSKSSGATGTGAGFDYGPYLMAMPALKVGQNASQQADEVTFQYAVPPTVDEGTGTGWVYNPLSGQIIANTTALDSTGQPYSGY